MNAIELALLADKYKDRLEETQSMSEISDLVDEIFDDIELAKMVLKKYIYSIWEEVKVCRYSPETESQMGNGGKNITGEVMSYLKQFPIKNV